MTLPAPPVNVQLEMQDGTMRAVDTVYEGIVDGTHQWVVVNPPPTHRVKSIKIDQLPPHTAVSLEIKR